jgi:hypothetical protein
MVFKEMNFMQEGNMRDLRIMAVIPLLVFTGCATIAGGTTQVVAVDSKPSGATCEASRNGLRLHAGTTPMSFPIDKSYSTMTISCVDAMNRRGTAINKPGPEPWFFGNLLLGGLVGMSIDLISSSVNRYDTAVAVVMGDQPTSEPARPVPLASPVAPAQVPVAVMAPAPVPVAVATPAQAPAAVTRSFGARPSAEGI